MILAHIQQHVSADLCVSSYLVTLRLKEKEMLMTHMGILFNSLTEKQNQRRWLILVRKIKTFSK
jgi:hypothetical protein